MKKLFLILIIILISGCDPQETISILEDYKSGIVKSVEIFDRGCCDDTISVILNVSENDELFKFGADNFIRKDLVLEKKAEIKTVYRNNPNYSIRYYICFEAIKDFCYKGRFGGKE